MPNVTTSQQAYHELQELCGAEVEEFWVLLLHTNCEIIAKEMVFRGTVDACPIFVRDVFRGACRLNASNLVIAHNHPSGDPRPSNEDFEVTKSLLKAGQVLQIPIMDHLIVTPKSYFSFADRGLIKVFSRTEQVLQAP